MLKDEREMQRLVFDVKMSGWSLTMRMATKQASVVFQSPLAVAEAFPTSML